MAMGCQREESEDQNLSFGLKLQLIDREKETDAIALLKGLLKEFVKPDHGSESGKQSKLTASAADQTPHGSTPKALRDIAEWTAYQQDSFETSRASKEAKMNSLNQC